MSPPPQVLRVAVPSPLYEQFDYLPPRGAAWDAILPGMRISVPFGRRRAVGVVIDRGPAKVAADRLKAAHALLDAAPVLDPSLLGLLTWAADYYQHPLGEVLATALPTLLRQGEPAEVEGAPLWRLTPAGEAAAPASLGRAPRQAELLARLQRAAPAGLGPEDFEALDFDWRRPLEALVERGWVLREHRPCLAVADAATPQAGPALNAGQRAAVDALVAAAPTGFACFLLEGVTGSGKTEVYLQAIEAVLRAGRQALVLVPEIGLTPQLIERFRRRFPGPIAALHSGLSDRERLCAWTLARNGEAAIVIGTRSAVFTPLARPGLIVVDEEHDPSFKQQDGFRYHARDLAVLRAREAGIPVVLGSATPSFESLHNVRRGAYRHLHLPERAGSAGHPTLRLLDVRSRRLEGGISDLLFAEMERHLAADGQVLLFLNRRGYAPTLLCHECGWVARCQRCDAHLTFHARDRRLRCHHCGAERPVPAQCPECGAPELLTLGQGTERLEQTLRSRFPDVGIVRIDRDSTRRKGAMADKLAGVRAGEHRILVGTQMLAKGHDFPDVTLVGIVDVDQGLFSADFRTSERLAQLIVQVAGRAGRAERPGEVLVQTHQPEHPLLRTLLARGYRAFAEAGLAEREAAGLPPFAALALLRAESPHATAPQAFLQAARERLRAEDAAAEVALLGPVAAPMELRAGRYRAQLLLQAPDRRPLQRLLRATVAGLGALPQARKVRWSVDVDPVDMF